MNRNAKTGVAPLSCYELSAVRALSSVFLDQLSHEPLGVMTRIHLIGAGAPGLSSFCASMFSIWRRSHDCLIAPWKEGMMDL
ncbi:hypothetical protein KBB27_04260 [Patescibacteria group bacterium]|nr:hypothetical protein [Patescibacteria group bacterium]